MTRFLLPQKVMPCRVKRRLWGGEHGRSRQSEVTFLLQGISDGDWDYGDSNKGWDGLQRDLEGWAGHEYEAKGMGVTWLLLKQVDNLLLTERTWMRVRPEGAGLELILGSSQRQVPEKLLKHGKQAIALWPRIGKQIKVRWRSNETTSNRKPWKVDELTREMG